MLTLTLTRHEFAQLGRGEGDIASILILRDGDQYAAYVEIEQLELGELLARYVVRSHLSERGVQTYTLSINGGSCTHDTRGEGEAYAVDCVRSNYARLARAAHRAGHDDYDATQHPRRPRG